MSQFGPLRKAAVVTASLVAALASGGTAFAASPLHPQVDLASGAQVQQHKAVKSMFNSVGARAAAYYYHMR